MRVESLRHQDVRAKKDVAAPEARQQLAADADVPHELAIGLGLNGANLLIENQRCPRWMGGVQVQLDGR